MPFRVLIVDDNPNTVLSLQKTIDWAALGCEVAGTALDGCEGIAQIRSLRPDIILTDIRMPEMDGLQMIEQARDAVPDARVIIITGHDEFQYASRAIKLAVFDYILKPINNTEVERTLARAVIALKSERANSDELSGAGKLRARALLTTLLVNESHGGQGVSAMLEEAGLTFAACYVMSVQPTEDRVLAQALLRRWDDDVVACCGARAVTLMLYDAMVIFVMRDDDSDAWREEAGAIAEAIMSQGVPVRIGVSALAHRRDELRAVYQQARQALWGVALKRGQRGLNFYEPGPKPGNERLADMQRVVDRLLASPSLDDDAATRAAATIARHAGARTADLRALLALYGMEVRRRYPVQLTDQIHEAVLEMWHVADEGDVLGCVRALFSGLRRAQERERAARLTLLTRNALAYIRLHAVEKLSLEEVARHLNVSAGHLSALVRRETGVTYQQHVLTAKIEVAKSMLADPRVRVEEIARAVGYENYVSFYNAFKRLEHMTPTEYRNRRVSV